MADEVIQEMRDVLERVWANPSSAHGPGQAARRVLAARLRAAGCPVDLIPVDGEGRRGLQAAHALIGADVALVSVMGANNETGVHMPMEELAEIVHAKGAPLPPSVRHATWPLASIA
ncbi:aminotransferase class V-fold PLP-dependent enzyme [Thiomonas sp.]